MSERLLPISEAAKRLGRVPHTLRLWEKRPDYPDELRAGRDSRGWRTYTEAQVEGLARWVEDNDIRPGSAFRK